MIVTVEPTRILIGTPDFVPRFLGLPKVWQIPAGATEEASPDSTWDYIEVAGTLRISRTRNTKLTFTHLFILPGGHLDCGIDDNNDPIPATVHVEFIVRDVALASNDPFQWGNGLLNFGRRDMCGAAKLAWAKATSDLPTGTMTITLDADPVGWAVGDVLLVTETHIVPGALPGHVEPFKPETGITIAAIAGRTITLSKPLATDHLALKEPNGDQVAFARVGNLTRNIVIRSENAAGTPGHMADVGMGAMWCGCYHENRQLGRTKNIPLNDIDPVTLTPGSNQKGRYADHKHHGMGFGSKSKGLVLLGINQRMGPKWGIAVHNVHDSEVTDNIAVGFPGAGFVTEDGNEVRNVFRGNLTAYCCGNHDGSPGAESDDIKRGNPGAAGNGYFFRGVKNIFEQNEAWNNFIGMDLFTIEIGSTPPQFYPSVPGGPNDTQLVFAENKPISFTGNIGHSNAVTGLEFWFVTEFEAHQQQLAFNGQFQFLQGTSNPAAPNFVDLLCVGEGSLIHGITSSLAYAQSLKIKRARIVGCDVGIPDGGAISVLLEDVFFQNVLDIDYINLPHRSHFTNCQHVPLPGHVPHYILFGREGVWDGTGTPPPSGTSLWRLQQGSTYLITNWQGTGKNYQLLTEQQLGSLAAPYSSNPPIQMVFNTPLAGITEAESWDQLGMAIYGDMVRDADAKRLDGISPGYAREGTTTPLGAAKFILTSPTPRQPAFTFVQDGSPDTMMRLYGVSTGDPTGTDKNILLSIDGGPRELHTPNPGEDKTHDDFTMTMKAVAEGTHTADTWRTDTQGHAIEASKMSFPFVVGPVTPPPPVPPPPPSVNAPIAAGATHVTGTGKAKASVTVYVNGIATATGLVGNPLAVFDVTVPALIPGQAITAIQTLNALASSPSNTVIVNAAPVAPPPPVVNSPLAAGAMNVTGTGADGASVSVLVDGVVKGAGAITGGVFDVMVMPALTEGQHVTATQAVGGLTSLPSNTVTVSGTPQDWHTVTWERLGTTQTYRIVG